MTIVARALALVVAVAGGFMVHAAPVNDWFDQANSFYKQGQFDSAEVYYRKILDAGVYNAAVYYNLGNTCFRRQELGEAVLYYERARRLSPEDSDIRHNLRFVRANLVDRLPEPHQGFFERALLAFHNLLTLRAQLWLLSGLLFVLSLLFAIGLFSTHNVRLWLIYVGVLIVVVLAAVGSSAGVKIYEAENVAHAVVLVSSADARNAPDGDKTLFQAHEGTKLRVRQRMDEWWLVSLPNGTSGWVRAEVLAEI
jgi:tetratricopeptide (TPR) repeat protein